MSVRRGFRREAVQEELANPKQTLAEIHAKVDAGIYAESVKEIIPLFAITLPMPPSVNAAYINVARVGRAKSKKYLTWQKDVEWQLLFKRPPISMPVTITIDLGFGKRLMATADVANREKCIIDTIVSCGILASDAAYIVRRISIGVCDEVEENKCRLSIYAVPFTSNACKP